VHGLDDALRRAELYLKNGADGVFIEAPESPEELARIGSEFRHVPQMANMLEGGRTPLIPPVELFRLGFSMIAYPTTLIFRVARTIEKALADLRAGQLTLAGQGVDFETFKEVMGFATWADVEDRFRD
jgi:2,3-dimethylmalate lyase